jgi:hypothetical protein
MAHENLHPQLILKQADLLRHAGLGSKQGLRGFGDVQAVAGDLKDVSQLLNVHFSRLRSALETGKSTYIIFGSNCLTKKAFFDLKSRFTMRRTRNLGLS